METALDKDLQRPDAFPTQPRHVELRETHISWVFLTETAVYKVKKPVCFPFLDFRTVAQRRAACEAEVRLNARMAPGVYLGVVPVRRRADGTHWFGDEGVLVDWAVHMKRLPDEARADVLLTRGALSGPDVDTIASSLAGFHARARSDAETARFGSLALVARSITENFAETRAVIGRYLTGAESDEVERYQRTFLRDHAGLLAHRARLGRCREGHGDLRLEHVYLMNGAIVVIDCIEFSDRFRNIDVCADVSFLTMDLAWHGRVDLAERLLARYARDADDFDVYAVADFYESYRAFVRGKVSTLLEADEGAPPSLRERARAEARRYFLLALAADRRAMLAPSLIVVGGVIASGKSTVADRLGGEIGAPVIEADRTRKHMLGVDPLQPVHDAPWTGAYDLRVTERVYEEVIRRADVVLASGRPAVLDASFRSAPQRRAARDLARAHAVPFRFVECCADARACRERLRRREHEGGVSDGRLAVFDDFCAHFEPIHELPQHEHLRVDTTLTIDESMDQLRGRIATWPKGLVA